MNSLTSSKSLFPEFSQVMSIISKISLPEHVDLIHELISKYQEQPQLIDPYLSDIIGWRSDNGGIIGILSDRTKNDNSFKTVDSNNASSQSHKQIGLSEIFIFELNYYLNEKEKQSIEESQRLLTLDSRIILSLRALFLFMQIRGIAILKYFPNEFSLFPLLFKLLKDIQFLKSWESECIIWLWLSHLSRNPFPIQSLTQEPQVYIKDLYETAISYFGTATKVKNCASEFLGQLLNRRDVISCGILLNFIQYSKEILLQVADDSNPTSFFNRYSVLQTLILVMKHSPDRTLILPYLMQIFDFVGLDISKESTTIKHLHMKFTQRIGLLLLKPIVVSWRYQKSRQNLLSNLMKGKISTISNSTNEISFQQINEDIEVPEEIETILDKLIGGLRDLDTVVRWSAAKGVGRITMRLPSDMGDDVVSFVLELLSDYEHDSSWHGGCLALAELARRGLLLPSRLDDVIPKILRALQYDIRRGSHSVGAHVRDAACYVCWAFARAYAPEVFEQYVSKLSSGLLKTAIFDREVNCRRAASAAFQENVGRQGNFPHGIEILTKADYFTLSNITTSYFEISDFVAQFDEYRFELINHVVDTKLGHWEKSIRELASKSLGALTHHCPTYMADTILKKLVPMTLEGEIETHHGALLAVSEIILKLDYKLIDPKLLVDIIHIIPNIESKRLYRGKGGEIMREAVCRFIECISLKEIELPAQISVITGLGRTQLKGTRSIYQRAINENLKHPNEDIVEQALLSLKAFTSTYYRTNDWIEKVQNLVIEPIIQELNTDSPAIRRGYLLALGSFPKMLIKDKFESYGNVILKNIPLEANIAERDAESRRNAVRAIISLCETIGVELLSDEYIEKVFNYLFIGIQDYATDSRGDVGLWVREASMFALKKFTILLSEKNKLNLNRATQVFQALLKQASEKIDRAREIAGKSIEQLLLNEKLIQGNFISNHIKLKDILIHENTIFASRITSQAKNDSISNSDDSMIEYSESIPLPMSVFSNKFQYQIRSEPSLLGIDWINPQFTFPLIVKFLQFEEYRFSIISGLVVSIGGLTKYISTSSCDSLTKYLKSNPNLVEPVANTILQVLTHYKHDKRIQIPSFKMLTLLFSNECFIDLQPSNSTFLERLIDILQDELRGTKDIQKLLSSVPLVMQIIPFEEPVRKKAFRLAFSLLINRFPKVRILTSEQIISLVQTYAEDIMDEMLIDEVLELLIETSWGESFEIEKESVNKLISMIDIIEPEP